VGGLLDVSVAGGTPQPGQFASRFSHDDCKGTQPASTGPAVPTGLPSVARAGERCAPVGSLIAAHARESNRDASAPCLLEVETAPAGIGQEFPPPSKRVPFADSATSISPDVHDCPRAVASWIDL
jgi:hypothetical protein